MTKKIVKDLRSKNRNTTTSSSKSNQMFRKLNLVKIRLKANKGRMLQDLSKN